MGEASLTPCGTTAPSLTRAPPHCPPKRAVCNQLFLLNNCVSCQAFAACLQIDGEAACFSQRGDPTREPPGGRYQRWQPTHQRCQPPHLWIALPGQKINCLGKKKKSVDSGHRKGLRKRLSQGKRKPCSAGAPELRQQIRVCVVQRLIWFSNKRKTQDWNRGWEREGGEGDWEQNDHWFTLGHSQAFRAGAWGGIHTQIFLLYVYALLWKYAFKLIHCPCFSFFLVLLLLRFPNQQRHFWLCFVFCNGFMGLFL